MTRFLDGPAKGQNLMLHRAALFLRVVQFGFKFDALDQLTDEPAPTEIIHAYTITELPTHCHIRATKGSGFYPMATYKLVEPQPTDAQMRDSAAWAAWVKLQPIPDFAKPKGDKC